MIDTDVIENVGERMGGFVNWGQLHGNATFIGPQNLSTPDLFVQWLGNEVLEGNTCRNYRKQMAEVTPGWGAWAFNGFSFSVVADPQSLAGGGDPDGLEQTMLDRFVVLRGNVVHNNCGIAVGATMESKGRIGDVRLWKTAGYASATTQALLSTAVSARSDCALTWGATSIKERVGVHAHGGQGC